MQRALRSVRPGSVRGIAFCVSIGHAELAARGLARAFHRVRSADGSRRPERRAAVPRAFGQMPRTGPSSSARSTFSTRHRQRRRTPLLCGPASLFVSRGRRPCSAKQGRPHVLDVGSAFTGQCKRCSRIKRSLRDGLQHASPGCRQLNNPARRSREQVLAALGGRCAWTTRTSAPSRAAPRRS
jgi:hypothetical protein